MIWERLSAAPGLTGRGSTGSPHSCHYGKPAVYAGLDAPGRNPGAARTPRCGARCLRAGHPAHPRYRGVVYAGATAIAAFAPIAPPLGRQCRDCWSEMSVLKSLLSESIFEPTEVAHTAQR